MTTKITIEPGDLEKQKIIEPRLCEVELLEDRFVYRLKFRAREPQREDEALPWIEVDNDFVFMHKRSAFRGIEKLWVQEEKRWKIIITFQSIGGQILFFKRQRECEAVFDQLVAYFFEEKE